MQKISKLTLALFCAMLLVSIADAQAQKKPKTKGLAKEIVGVWKYESLDIECDTSGKQVHTELLNSLKKAMEDDFTPDTYYVFKHNNTYIIHYTPEDTTDIEKGTWKLKGDVIHLTSEEAMNMLSEATILQNKLRIAMFVPVKEEVKIILKLTKKQ